MDVMKIDDNTRKTKKGKFETQEQSWKTNCFGN